jgi:hypothetical protein
MASIELGLELGERTRGVAVGGLGWPYRFGFGHPPL